MKIAVELEPAAAEPGEVAYKWDADTDILSAQIASTGPSKGMSGSVGLEGADGSWVILDVAAGRIHGVEVAVWPDVRKLPTLALPTNVEDAYVTIPARRSQPHIASMETVTHLIAEADAAQRHYHFRLGKPRLSRTVRIARDLLLDLDEKSQIAGLWLLNVPPSPTPSDLDL